MTTNTNNLTLASSAAVKANGWTRFIQWVQDGNHVLLTRRVMRSPAGGQIGTYPLLAVAVPISWVDYVESPDITHQGDDVEVQKITSHQARQYLLPYCRKLYEAEADGYNMRYEVRSYRSAGALRATSSAAASMDLFALVGVEWYARTANTSVRELEHVDETPHWINKSKHR